MLGTKMMNIYIANIVFSFFHTVDINENLVKDDRNKKRKQVLKIIMKHDIRSNPNAQF